MKKNFNLAVLASQILMPSPTFKRWLVAKTSLLIFVTMMCGILSPIAARADGTSDLVGALGALKVHVLGTTLLTTQQIDAYKKIIDANVALFGNTRSVISSALDLVRTYDKTVGPLFATAAHASFTRATVTANPADIHWTIYTVMQDIMDKTYTAENINNNGDLLNGFKFESSSNFPGACAPPVDPNKINTVAISASYLDTWGWPVMMDGPGTFARKPTGNYLAPGSIATVTVPQALVGKGFQIRVECHSWDFSNKPKIVRLDRVSRVYDINSIDTKVANPLGGGIYIEVPFLANAGVVNVQIKNAVRSPFFSATSHHKTTKEEWLNTERNFKAPWADFQSDKNMFQVPTDWIYAKDDPTTLMANWDLSVDTTNDLLGFPHIRGKEALYSQVDLQLRADAGAPGYPSVNDTYYPTMKYGGNVNHYLLTGPQSTPFYIFHEMGHGYLFPKFPNEAESAVNLLDVAVLNGRFGQNLEQAFRLSANCFNTYQTLDTTAVSWMTVFNFQKGLPMEPIEKQYQLKGHGKFVEIARLFGWSALNNYGYSFTKDYENNISRPMDVDSLLLRLSKSVGCDIRPLFHFWGVPPVNSSTLDTAIKNAGLKPSPSIYNTLVRYKSLIPANNVAFRDFAFKWWGKQPSVSGYSEENNHARQWDNLSGEMYTEATSAAINKRVQGIINLYFPLMANSQNVFTEINTAKTITLTGIDSSGNTLKYSILTSPSHGTLTGTAPNMTYTPAKDYRGSDSFAFNVTNVQGVTSASATVSIVMGSTAVPTPKPTATPTPIPTSGGPLGYTYCAEEGATYILNGVCDVAYGINGNYSYLYNKTGSITFNNSTFGDPAPNYHKKGYYKPSVIKQPTPTPKPTATPTPIAPSGFIYCAREGSSFTLPGYCDVAYGVNGTYYYKYGVTGNITFNNATFGDPVYGIAKFGFYKPSSQTTPTPKPTSAPIPTYTLVVNGGTGSGNYPSGKVTAIVANPASSGKVFDKWVIVLGNPAIANVGLESTTLTMPANGASVTATFKDVTLSVSNVLGNYSRLPVQNSWHTGVIELSGSTLQWRNTAGITWPLIPDLANNKLLTTSQCPYYSNLGGDAFILKTKINSNGSLVVEGFTFSNELFSNSASTPTPTSAPTPTPTESNTTNALNTFYATFGGTNSFPEGLREVIEGTLRSEDDLVNGSQNSSTVLQRINSILTKYPNYYWYDIWNTWASKYNKSPYMGDAPAYYDMTMLKDIANLGSQVTYTTSTPIVMTVLICDNAHGQQPINPDFTQGKTVDVKALIGICDNDHAVLRQSLRLFQRYIWAITRGELRLELQFQHIQQPINFHYDQANKTVPLDNYTQPLNYVSSSIKNNTDMWWLIFPDGRPIINGTVVGGGWGGMGGYNGSPYFISPDSAVLYNQFNGGRVIEYTEVERRCYLPQWVEHEFYHHLFRLYPEFGLESTSHQWFTVENWPKDFVLGHEPDYYSQALNKRLLGATTRLAVKLKTAPNWRN